ncbi:MAG: hypothetical protein ACRCVN_03625 [Spirochaetia bacterium]
MRILQRTILTVFLLFLCCDLYAQSFKLAVANLRIQLSDKEKTVMEYFADILINTGLKQEAKIYTHAATQPLNFYATLLQYQNEIFILAPLSFTSLSEKYTLEIRDINKKIVRERNLSFISQIDNLAVLKIADAGIFNNIVWQELEQLPSETTQRKSRTITLLTSEMGTQTIPRRTLPFEMMGSLILNKEKVPIGILNYYDAAMNMNPLRNIFSQITMLDEQPKSEGTPANLEADIEKFIMHIENRNFSNAHRFLSKKLIYDFGCAAYFYNKDNEKLFSTIITNADIRRGGLYPLAKSMVALFIQSNDKSDWEIQFRIIVSMADRVNINPSIVTLSLNRNIVPTSWKLGPDRWQLDSLPLPFENRLIPYLSYDAQKVLNIPMRPFSGLFLEYNMAFYPVEIFQGDQLSGYIGYHLNFTRYLSMNFKIGLLGLLYKSEFDRGGVHESYKALIQLLVGKIGLQLHYPIMLGKNAYVMPFVGVDIGMGYALDNAESTFGDFDEFLIRRSPFTLILGWQTGLEFGFIAGAPMGIGLTIGYDQDFFSQQTMKKGLPGARNIKGSASEFYASIYYKIGLQKLKNKTD